MLFACFCQAQAAQNLPNWEPGLKAPQCVSKHGPRVRGGLLEIRISRAPSDLRGESPRLRGLCGPRSVTGWSLCAVWKRKLDAYPYNPSREDPKMTSSVKGLLQEPSEKHFLGHTGATSCCERTRMLIPQTERICKKSLLNPRVVTWKSLWPTRNRKEGLKCLSNWSGQPVTCVILFSRGVGRKRQHMPTGPYGWNSAPGHQYPPRCVRF